MKQTEAQKRSQARYRQTVRGRAARRREKQKLHPLYSVWSGMKARCTNPDRHNYERYGGRGIKVCARWMASFALFVEDVGERPAGTSLDRINNDGNYEPGNVRWATPKEQQNNRRRREYIWGG